jgi:hypothetical protein
MQLERPLKAALDETAADSQHPSPMADGPMKAAELRGAAAKLLALAAEARIQGDAMYSEFLSARASQLLGDVQVLERAQRPLVADTGGPSTAAATASARPKE